MTCALLDTEQNNLKHRTDIDFSGVIKCTSD